MVSSVLSSLVCVLCVILLPAVWADYCSSYRGTDGLYHDPLQCGSQYCCGDLNKIYCCSEQENRLFQENKEGHFERLSRRPDIAAIIGSIATIIIPIFICVILIICCVCPCCLLYKKCRERRNGMQQTVITTTVVNPPQPPLTPFGYEPSHPGYQPVPVLHGYGGPPMPTAPPPSYLEATYPAHSPVPYPQGQPMYPLPPPGQNYPPPSHLDELVQMPYNPSYRPNP
ncbi:protein shisa-5-like isoform X1 [Seriola dumerili]|uniref:protein shisa-5-like isoform X1 n=2 Tax=Seriola dumerili TaxID=41447 RepID=UPI000BBE2B8D|nr:protein shisa-5-like isoform X1 [Seriola dumerili]